MEDQRCCARRAGCLALEGSMNVEISWIIGGRVVPLHHGLFSFPIIHERYPRHQLVRVLEDGIHQVAEVAELSEDGLLLKQIRVVLEPAMEPVVFVVFKGFHRQIELGDAGLEFQLFHFKSRNFKHLLRDVLEREHHLEQRTGVHRALRKQFFDQFLERNILMRVRFQGTCADLSNQIAEGHVRGKVGAEHQRIHEEPNQVFNFDLATGRGRSADQNAVLAGVAPEQRLESRHRYHEQGGALGLREFLQPCKNLAIEDQFLGRSVPAVGCRARTVGGQIENCLRAGQFVFPVLDLLGQQFAGDVFALPLRVLYILNREFGKLRFPSARKSLITMSQFAEKD